MGPKYAGSILWVHQNQTLKLQRSFKSNSEEKENESNTSIQSNKDLKNNNFRLRIVYSHPQSF